MENFRVIFGIIPAQVFLIHSLDFQNILFIELFTTIKPSLIAGFFVGLLNVKNEQTLYIPE